MNKMWFTFMQDAGASVLEALLSPGVMFMSLLPPSLQHGDASRGLLVSAGVSALCWLTVLVGARKLIRLGRRAVGRARLAFRSRWFLLRKKLARRMALLAAADRTRRDATETEVQFDALDLAVLGSAAELHAGFSMSAPDLAPKLKVRPQTVQRSLEKLAVNMMLERTIGSTDDFQNYRLTQSGARFLSMCERQGKRARLL